MTRSQCWQESFELYTGSVRRGGGLLGVALSEVMPPTLSSIVPRGRSLTPSTSTTTSTGTTPEFRIRYSASSSLDLVGFSDADFAGCGIDR
jgi:hypothetical protein